MPETYIIFEVAGADYAVRSDLVERIEMVDHITHVPNAPDFVEGVVSMRGQVIPIISLRRRFHLEVLPLNLRSRVVIIRMDGRLVGMLADTAREFLRVAEDQIQPVPEGLSGPGIAYLVGVISLPKRVILAVNLERLLTVDEHSALVNQPNPSA